MNADTPRSFIDSRGNYSNKDFELATGHPKDPTDQPGEWGDHVWLGNIPVGDSSSVKHLIKTGQATFAEEMQKSRAGAMKVGAQIASTPKEFYDVMSSVTDHGRPATKIKNLEDGEIKSVGLRYEDGTGETRMLKSSLYNV